MGDNRPASTDRVASEIASILDTPENIAHKVVLTLDKFITEESTSELQAFLLENDEVVHIVEDCLYDVLQCVLNWLSHSNGKCCDDVQKILHTFLSSLYIRYDVDQCLILLTGLLSTSKFGLPLCYILEALKPCLPKISVRHFKRVMPIFTALRQQIGYTNCKGVSINRFVRVLETVIDFYHSVLLTPKFSEITESHRESIFHNFLFIFSQPLYIHSGDEKVERIFLKCFEMLLQFKKDMLSFYLKSIVHEDYLVSQRGLANLLVPAWLRLISFILLKATADQLHNSWSHVFTNLHLLEIFQPIINYILNPKYQTAAAESSKASQAMVKDTSSDGVEDFSFEFYTVLRGYAIDLLAGLILRNPTPITLSWWKGGDRLLWFDWLEQIVTEPISSESLPPNVVKALSCLESLITKSTYTAQHQLFLNLFAGKECASHYGFRGHILTCCKNYLHEVWVKVEEIGLSQLVANEEAVGESDVQLPLNETQFISLCESIFHFSTSSTDSLLDQSGWLLSAVNMIMYIILRYKAVCNHHTDEGCVCLVVLRGLLRVEDGTCKLNSAFLHPLKKELSSIITTTERLIHDHDTRRKRGDTNVGSADIHPIRHSFLRLQLLSTTIDRLVKEARTALPQTLSHNLVQNL